MKKTVRIFPHKMKGEGHYLALLRKGDEKAEAKRLAEKTAATKGFSEKERKETSGRFGIILSRYFLGDGCKPS